MADSNGLAKDGYILPEDSKSNKLGPVGTLIGPKSKLKISKSSVSSLNQGEGGERGASGRGISNKQNT